MLKLFSVVGIALIVFPSYYGHAKDLSVDDDKYFENRQWDNAIDEYEKLLSKNKNQPEIYFKLGNAYSKKGDLKKAVEAFNKATQLKPDYSEAYQKLSELSMQIEVPEDELKVCLKEVQKDPNNADAHLRLDNVL